MPRGKKVRVLIASSLEEDLVRRIAGVDSRLDVIYRPDLLRPPRFPSDHEGASRERTDEEEAEWRRLLAAADVLFDFDQTHRDDLPELAPNLKWIQATASGIGQFVAEAGYAERMPDTVITNTSGVHGQPLSEFCVMAILAFRKGLFTMIRNQSEKRWERYAGTDLEGRTVVIVGLGGIGEEVARLCKELRMHVVGVGRSTSPGADRSTSPGADRSTLPGTDRGSHVDEYVPVARLREVLPRAEHLILVTPHTPETESLIGPEELALLPSRAILVNIGRGNVVDEVALVEALNSGRLAGAALDVFAHEPLPKDSPFWDLPNVLVSPHSGSTTERENGRITELFCENLRRFLAGEPLLNIVDPGRYY